MSSQSENQPRRILPHEGEVHRDTGSLSRFMSSEEAAVWFVEVEEYAMFLLDLDGLIVSWNAGVERVLQYQEHEFVRQSAAIIFTDEDRQQGAPQQEMKTALKEGRAIDERWHERKDGSRFWASGVLTLLHDEAGQPCGFAKIMRDRTQDKLREEERELLLREAEEARQVAELAQAEAEKINRRKDRFITVISHEMRSPLSTLCGWIKLLHSRNLDELEADQALDAMLRNADSLVHLVNDLLDIEQLRSGRFNLQFEPVNLVALTARVIEELRPQAQSKSIHLQTQIGSVDHYVQGDPLRLEQVLRNLLSNALKFTPAEGIVEVGLAQHGEFIELRVSDTGKGIPGELLSQIFEEFRQVDETDKRQHGGLGLGLAIVHELVKLHGGSITAQSEGLDRGATFHVLLPAGNEHQRKLQQGS